MNKRIAAFYLPIFITAFSLFVSSCTRIHDATELGDDLVPAVDNINTFDTTITVEAYNEQFFLANANPLFTDSARMFKTGTHFIGKITSDLLFGTSEAITFMELKPPGYKYYFEGPDDSLTLDSAVLVMDYIETYGDTNALQTVSVYEIENSTANNFKIDSNYLIRENNFTYPKLLGSRIFAPNILNDSIKVFRDTAKNQLRIKLDQDGNYLGTKFLKDFDSSGAYSSDSAFRKNFKGFAVKSAAGGNALMGFSLASGKTKLALYYKYRKLGVDRDTVRYFTFNSASANANYVTRNYSGYPVGLAQNGTTPDDLIYLQNTPGTFGRIKIPDLLNTANRVVHRAELIVEQVYDPSDALFYRPEQLLVDVLDTTLKNYRFMPYDFGFDVSNNPNATSFGTFGRLTVDGAGNPINVWKFNLSRYVQNVLTRTEPSHELRILSPLLVFDIYKPNPNVTGVYSFFAANSAIARGRVRVGGGNRPTQKMRLRIVFSRI